MTDKLINVVMRLAIIATCITAIVVAFRGMK